MKKINILQINSDKIIKNEDLLALKGGDFPCTCLCWDKDTYVILGYLVAGDGNCPNACAYAWKNATGSCQC